MTTTKTLLDFVLDPVEFERVSVVADLIAHAENKLRRAALILAGIEGEAKGQLGIARDLTIAQLELSELSAWLTAHWYPLHYHLHPSQSEPQAVPSEIGPEEEKRTVH